MVYCKQFCGAASMEAGERLARCDERRGALSLSAKRGSYANGKSADGDGASPGTGPVCGIGR